MLSREEIEQMINQKIEPLTEEIAALKAQLGKLISSPLTTAIYGNH